MNPFLRRLMGAYLDEASDGTQGGAGGVGATPDSGDGGTVIDGEATRVDDASASDAAGKQAVKTEPKDVSVEAMAEAIQTGLDEQRARGPDGKFIAKDDVAKAAPKVDDKAAAPGNPATDPAALEADRKAKEKADADAVKALKLDDIKLTPDMEKVLKADARERFHKITNYAKARDAEIATLTAEMQPLREARDNFMAIFEESHTGPEELGRLLDFNKLVKTGNYAAALEQVEGYRAQLYRAMGKEAPGVDLVSEFSDLNARVDDGSLSREDAVALANARRREAALQQQGNQQRQQQDQTASVQRARDDGLKAIETWIGKTSKEDANFAAREAIVSAQIPDIIKQYPPHLWATTIAAIYRATPAPAVRATQNLPTGDAPLRPNGTRPGPAAPSSMEQAIAQGLGYQL